MIGTNKKDSQETVNGLLADLAEGKLPEPELAGDATAIETLLAERKPDHVTYEGWQAIDAAEQAAGEPQGRPRVKFCRVEEMVEAAPACAQSRRAEPSRGQVSGRHKGRLARRGHARGNRLGPELVRSVSADGVGVPAAGSAPAARCD